MGSTVSRLQRRYEEAAHFLPPRPQEFLVLIYRPRKDEMLSRPWTYPVTLKLGPLDWESSALTKKPLLRTPNTKKTIILLYKCCFFWLHFFDLFFFISGLAFTWHWRITRQQEKGEANSNFSLPLALIWLSRHLPAQS